MPVTGKCTKPPPTPARFSPRSRRSPPKPSYCDIVVAPPYTSIPAAVESAKNTKIAIAGQNVYWEKEGAFTGEISPAMLVEAGCRYVIIGHSERRQLFGETDEVGSQKNQSRPRRGTHSHRLRRRNPLRTRSRPHRAHLRIAAPQRPRRVDRRGVLPYSDGVRASVGHRHRPHRYP